jgi:rhodanese-related sulfurtransferase
MVDNVSSQQAWDALQNEPDAQLVDVRTTAEWSYVGIPDLTPIGKRTALIVWQEFPSGEINPDFKAELARANLGHEQPIYFICRSGARSMAAAREARAAGYTKVFNVADGFEGPPNEEQHRGEIAGWKAAGLPWRQS